MAGTITISNELDTNSLDNKIIQTNKPYTISLNKATSNFSYEMDIVSSFISKQRIFNLPVIQGGKNFSPKYFTDTDLIRMPDIRKYDFNHTLYLTDFLHEQSHWTIQPNRLNRKTPSKDTNLAGYAREELIAEMSAMAVFNHFYGGKVGNHNLLNHLVYLTGWAEIIYRKEELGQSNALISRPFKFSENQNKQFREKLTEYLQEAREQSLQVVEALVGKEEFKERLAYLREKLLKPDGTLKTRAELIEEKVEINTFNPALINPKFKDTAEKENQEDIIPFLTDKELKEQQEQSALNEEVKAEAKPKTESLNEELEDLSTLLEEFENEEYADFTNLLNEVLNDNKLSEQEQLNNQSQDELSVFDKKELGLLNQEEERKLVYSIVLLEAQKLREKLAEYGFPTEEYKDTFNNKEGKFSLDDFCVNSIQRGDSGLLIAVNTFEDLSNFAKLHIDNFKKFREDYEIPKIDNLEDVKNLRYGITPAFHNAVRDLVYHSPKTDKEFIYKTNYIINKIGGKKGMSFNEFKEALFTNNRLTPEKAFMGLFMAISTANQEVKDNFISAIKACNNYRQYEKELHELLKAENRTATTKEMSKYERLQRQMYHAGNKLNNLISNASDVMLDYSPFSLAFNTVGDNLNQLLTSSMLGVFEKEKTNNYKLVLNPEIKSQVEEIYNNCETTKINDNQISFKYQDKILNLNYSGIKNPFDEDVVSLNKGIFDEVIKPTKKEEKQKLEDEIKSISEGEVLTIDDKHQELLGTTFIHLTKDEDFEAKLTALLIEQNQTLYTRNLSQQTLFFDITDNDNFNKHIDTANEIIDLGFKWNSTYKPNSRPSNEEITVSYLAEANHIILTPLTTKYREFYPTSRYDYETDTVQLPHAGGLQHHFNFVQDSFKAFTHWAGSPERLDRDSWKTLHYADKEEISQCIDIVIAYQKQAKSILNGSQDLSKAQKEQYIEAIMQVEEFKQSFDKVKEVFVARAKEDLIASIASLAVFKHPDSYYTNDIDVANIYAGVRNEAVKVKFLTEDFTLENILTYSKKTNTEIDTGTILQTSFLDTGLWLNSVDYLNQLAIGEIVISNSNQENTLSKYISEAEYDAKLAVESLRQKVDWEEVRREKIDVERQQTENKSEVKTAIPEITTPNVEITTPTINNEIVNTESVIEKQSSKNLTADSPALENSVIDEKAKIKEVKNDILGQYLDYSANPTKEQKLYLADYVNKMVDKAYQQGGLEQVLNVQQMAQQKLNFLITNFKRNNAVNDNTANANTEISESKQNTETKQEVKAEEKTITSIIDNANNPKSLNTSNTSTATVNNDNSQSSNQTLNKSVNQPLNNTKPKKGKGR